MLLEYQVGTSGQERGVAIKGGSYLPLAHGANFAEMFDEIDYNTQQMSVSTIIFASDLRKSLILTMSSDPMRLASSR